MASNHYMAMRRNIGQLGRSLLPRPITKDLLELTPRVSVRALSYRMLCHAEFENFLEARALEVVAAVDASWKRRGHISHSTLCLLAFSGIKLNALPDTLQVPSERITPDGRVSRAISEFNHYVRKRNHGIKEENLIALLVRIGLKPVLLDEVLVADMTDLGVKRGEVAHGGAAGYVTRGVNPRDEFEQVRRISEGLRPVDAALTVLLRAAL